MFDFVAVMGGIWVAIYFIVLGLKRWLTYPRAGYIKISEAQKQQIRMVILGGGSFLGGTGRVFPFHYQQPAGMGRRVLYAHVWYHVQRDNCPIGLLVESFPLVCLCRVDFRIFLRASVVGYTAQSQFPGTWWHYTAIRTMPAYPFPA